MAPQFPILAFSFFSSYSVSSSWFFSSSSFSSYSVSSSWFFSFSSSSFSSSSFSSSSFSSSSSSFFFFSLLLATGDTCGRSTSKLCSYINGGASRKQSSFICSELEGLSRMKYMIGRLCSSKKWLLQKYLLRISKLYLLQFDLLSSIPKAYVYHLLAFIFIIRYKTLIYCALYDGILLFSSVT